MGQRRATITPEALESLAAQGMNRTEISKLFGVTPQRIGQIVSKGPHKEAFERGQANLVQRIKQAQIKSALDGNVTAQIWAGKQWCQQQDAPTTSKLEVDQRVSVRYIACWGRDDAEIQAASNPMIDAGEEDCWEEDA